MSFNPLMNGALLQQQLQAQAMAGRVAQPFGQVPGITPPFGQMAGLPQTLGQMGLPPSPGLTQTVPQLNGLPLQANGQTLPQLNGLPPQANGQALPQLNGQGIPQANGQAGLPATNGQAQAQPLTQAQLPGQAQTFRTRPNNIPIFIDQEPVEFEPLTLAEAETVPEIFPEERVQVFANVPPGQILFAEEVPLPSRRRCRRLNNGL